jgi:exopolyphosphatase/guanosine-5'-triphosphate,3'-diphosphate pyrophosphatase
LAAVDLGTNSAHLVVAKVDGTAIEVLEREREMVRLGSSGNGEMRTLAPEAIDRAVAALSRFAQIAAIHDAPVRVTATSAVREAENRHQLIGRAREEAGVDVEVISGFEEARLIHLGVLQALPVFDEQMLLCDIGGGSTELVLGRKGEVLTSRSFKLGAIRLTDQFLAAAPLDPAAVDRCRRYIRATLAPYLRELELRCFDVAVGASGTIGAVCWMAAVQREESGERARPRTINNFKVTSEEIDQVVLRLARASTTEERAALSGLDPRRADIVLAGALILEQVVAGMAIEELTFSDYALREGVLLDTWQRRHDVELEGLSDLRRRNVDKLAEQLDEDRGHSAEVARLALELFDGTAEIHGLDDDSRELLEAGAVLSNIGLFVSHAAHHKHSYYLIRNSEQLTGFTDREIELIAQIARYHRKSAPRDKHDVFAALPSEDQHRVRVLAALVRVAVGLDRNHTGRVAELRCKLHEGTLVVEVVARGDEDISLELYAATQRQEPLEQALALPVEFVQQA